jgi:hypothetical protein
VLRRLVESIVCHKSFKKIEKEKLEQTEKEAAENGMKKGK